MNTAPLRCPKVLTVCFATTMLLSGTLWSGPVFAQSTGQKTFPSSADAINQFVRAVKSGDSASLAAILGKGGESIISSGDRVADSTARAIFLDRYAVKESLVPSGENTYILTVGSDNWPVPTPLRKKGDKWYFDGAAGAQEVLYRRIGKNELATIDVCRGIVAAQRDYVKTAHDGKPAGTYALRIVSHPGKQDGLYWKPKPGEPASPAGPLIANATQEGYATTGERTPYHGYYYRILKHPDGFVLLAYPAKYRSSGVKTFAVTSNGIIYQKDLGAKTDEIAQTMTQVRIDKSWKPVPELAETDGM